MASVDPPARLNKRSSASMRSSGCPASRPRAPARAGRPPARLLHSSAWQLLMAVAARGSIRPVSSAARIVESTSPPKQLEPSGRLGESQLDSGLSSQRSFTHLPRLRVALHQQQRLLAHRHGPDHPRRRALRRLRGASDAEAKSVMSATCWQCIAHSPPKRATAATVSHEAPRPPWARGTTRNSAPSLFPAARGATARAGRRRR